MILLLAIEQHLIFSHPVYPLIIRKTGWSEKEARTFMKVFFKKIDPEMVDTDEKNEMLSYWASYLKSAGLVSPSRNARVCIALYQSVEVGYEPKRVNEILSLMVKKNFSYRQMIKLLKEMRFLVENFGYYPDDLARYAVSLLRSSAPPKQVIKKFRKGVKNLKVERASGKGAQGYDSIPFFGSGKLPTSDEAPDAYIFEDLE